MSIALPNVSVSPRDCDFSVEWEFNRESDSMDMLTEYPTVFSITQSTLELNEVNSDFIAQFQPLIGLSTYFFSGTLSDTAKTQTKQY